MIMKSFIIGVIAGALSWLISWMVSGKFEPFDGGFYVQQIFLSSISFFIAYKFISWIKVFQTIIGIYIGQVLYVYHFGSSETRAWILVGMITIMVLCFFPLVSGILGTIIGKTKEKKA